MNVQGTGIAASVRTTGERSSRDLRVDLVRGVALLIIFSDHVIGNPVRDFMPISLGFSDMAEVFLFLSGYVNGIRRDRPIIPSGSRLLLHRGEGKLRQLLRLYGVLLLMHVLTVMLLTIANASGAQSVSLSQLMLPRSSPEPSLWQVMTLQSMLVNSCVLALYLILLGIVPFVSMWLRRRPIITIAASVAVYMAVQFWPDSVALPSPWAEAFFFNPFAWQLPFVLGIVCGRGGQRCKALIPQSLLAIFVAAIGLEMAFLIKVGWWMPPVEIALDKDTLAPLRLLHFYCVLIVGRTLLPGNMRFLASGLLRPIILCGQHSLVTYCTGGLLATTGTLLLTKYGSETAWTVAVNTSGWILCLLVAYAAESYRRRRQSVAEQSRSGKFPNIRVPLLVCMFVATASISGTVARAAVAEDSVADRRGTDQGFLRKTWVDESGLSHRYVVFVPHHRQPGVRPPVLMFLNGMGENGNDGLRQITNNFGVNLWENREHFPFIAVAPQCRTEGSWTAGSQDVQWALQILEATIHEYDADADRVYLTGVSSGGSGVWAMASAHPDRFAAVAPMCGSGGADTEKLTRAGVPIWNFSNERDSREVVDFSRTIRKQLLESGSSPLFTEYPVGGHDCWNRAYRTTALYRWLLEQQRSKNHETLPFTFLSPDRILHDSDSSEPSTWSADGDVLVGQSTPPAENVARVSDAGLLFDPGTANTIGRCESGRLVSSESSHEFELHGDVWMDENLDCRIGLLTDHPTALEYWLSIVLSRQGSGGMSCSQGKIMTSLETVAGERPASQTRGTLGTERFMASLDPAAQQTLRPDAWNDIRISVRDNHLHLRLNGWPAIRVKLGDPETSDEILRYRYILQAPENGAAVRWRYVRTRHSRRGASTP